MPVVFVPRETEPGETRVAATPSSVRALTQMGFRVVLEADAGQGSLFSNSDYRSAGAEISTDPRSAYWMADIVLKYHPPAYRKAIELDEASQLKKGALVISFLWPTQDIVMVQRLASAQVTSFAINQVPPMPRSQSMDALASQSSIRGYKAVVLAADTLPRMMPLMMTAAGTVHPAKVVVLGLGIAGVQAVATARRLGAEVEGLGIHSHIRQQVESLGASFTSLAPKEPETAQQRKTEAERAAERLRFQQTLTHKHTSNADIVIATFVDEGGVAPHILAESTLQGMKQGSVVVDLAGNCPFSVPEQVTQHHGVTVFAPVDLARAQASDASHMYANNVLAVIRHLFKNDELTYDFTDPITKKAVVTHQGEILHKRALDKMAPSQRKRVSQQFGKPRGSSPSPSPEAKKTPTPDPKKGTPPPSGKKASTPVPRLDSLSAQQGKLSRPPGGDNKSSSKA